MWLCLVALCIILDVFSLSRILSSSLSVLLSFLFYVVCLNLSDSFWSLMAVQVCVCNILSLLWLCPSIAFSHFLALSGSLSDGLMIVLILWG